MDVRWRGWLGESQLMHISVDKEYVPAKNTRLQELLPAVVMQ